MRTIQLDASDWRSRDDFYNAIFEALGSPSWHGRNFNALRDSIGVGQINRIEPPFRILITGLADAAPEAQQAGRDFCDLIKELRLTGRDIEALCE